MYIFSISKPKVYVEALPNYNFIYDFLNGCENQCLYLRIKSSRADLVLKTM